MAQDCEHDWRVVLTLGTRGLRVVCIKCGIPKPEEETKDVPHPTADKVQ